MKLSGAARRKRDLEQARALAERHGFEVVRVGTAERRRRELEHAGEDATGIEAFAELGPAPLDDPTHALKWVRRAQMLALRLATSAPFSEEIRERLRWTKDLSAVIGMTHPRAELEESVFKLKKAVDKHRIGHGPMRSERGADVPRTPNSRGQRRGPRPMPPGDDNPPEGGES